MLTSTPGATVLIEGHAFTADYRITMTLPGAASIYDDVSFSASHISIEAQTTTDAPANSRLQPGYPVRSASFTLEGLVDVRDATKTAAWLFGEYPKKASDGSVSPLYRVRTLFIPVTIDLGVLVPGSATPEWFRRFTGRVDNVQVDYATGSVQISCVDLRSQLHTNPSVPSVITAPPYNAGLTSEFAMDALLRAASNDAISSWPAIRPQCVLAAGMRSSLWPEVGSLVGTGWNAALFGAAAVPTFAPGVMGTAVLPNNGIAYNTSAPIGTDGLIEVWSNSPFMPGVQVLDNAGQEGFELIAGGTNWLIWHIVATNIDEQVDTGIPVFSTPRAGRLRMQFHQVVGSTSWSATVQTKNGATFSTGTHVASAPRTATYGLVRSSDGGGTIEALQVTTETAMPANDQFVPQAVLDPSLNPLTVVPPITGDPWQTIQQMCDAELGVGGFDDFGVFRFLNRDTLNSSSSVRDISSKQGLIGLTGGTSASALFNHVKADYTLWNFGATSSVWKLTGVMSVPPGQTVIVNTTTDETGNALFAAVDTVFSKLPQSGDLNDGNSYYRASLDSAGVTEHPGLTITVVPLTSGTMRISLTNKTTKTAWLVSSANYTDITVGTPVLSVGGRPVTQANTIITEAQWPPLATDGSGGAASDPVLGDIVYEMPSNLWRQNPAATAAVAGAALSDGAFLRPNFDTIPIQPDFRLQPADRLHLVDDDASGMDDYVRLWGYAITLGPNECAMTISAVAIAKPGGWILGLPGRTELSLTTNL